MLATEYRKVRLECTGVVIQPYPSSEVNITNYPPETNGIDCGRHFWLIAEIDKIVLHKNTRDNIR